MYLYETTKPLTLLTLLNIFTPSRIRSDHGTKEEWAPFVACVQGMGLDRPAGSVQVKRHVELNAGGRGFHP